MRKQTLSSFINKVESADLDSLTFIDTYADVIKFNGNEEDLTHNNKQLQGSVDVKMVIDLVSLDREIVFEERVYLAYGDIYKYMYNTDVYDINNEQHIIDRFNDFVLDEEVVKLLNDKLESELSSSVNNENVSKLVDDTKKILDDVNFLKNAHYSVLIENSELTLEFQKRTDELDVSKILLQFVIHEDMTPEYLSKIISEEVQMQYELPFEISFDLDVIITKADDKLNEDIDSALKPLQQIAEEQTGRSGIQFNVATEIKEGYCDFERGTIDMKRYIDDVLKSFRDTKVDHQSCIELLEVVYLYSEQVGLDIYDDFNWFDELHMYVLEDTMFELTSGTTEYLNLNLEYNIDNFSENYKKVFTKYSDYIMTKLYGNYIENLDLTKVYCFQEDSVHLWGEYKFINIENTVCLANVNWYDFSKHTDLDINDLRAQLEWFEEEYEVSYSHQLRAVDEIKKGNIPSYLTSTGIRQDLNDILEKLVPKNSQSLNTNLNGFLDEKTMKDINESISMKHVLVDMRIMSSPNQIQLEQQYTQALEKCEVKLKYINDCIGYANDELGKISKSNAENILDKLENVCSNIFKNNDRNSLNTLLDLNRNDRFRLGIQTQLNVESKHLGDNTKLFLKLDQRLEKPKMKLKL